MAEWVEERGVTPLAGVWGAGYPPLLVGGTSAGGDAEMATHTNVSRDAAIMHGLSQVAEIESINS